jgi:electron transfer flavoprotein beta subunit
VPDNDSELVVDTSTGRIGFAGRPVYKMNRYDEYATEAALQIRQGVDQTTVDAVSVGPERVDDVLKRALGMGVDHGIMIHQHSADPHGPLSVATAIARMVQRSRYDLILTGALSEDEMNGTTGPMIAAHLDWSCAVNVLSLNPVPKKSVIRAERETDGGDRELLDIPLPAVLTIQTGTRQPRYPRLSMMLRANRYPLDILDMKTLDPATANERIIKMDYPGSSRNGVFLSGSLENKSEKLIQLLRQKALLP